MHMPAAVGSRVKYVMDTPEVIWGCLEAGSHLEAARRLLRVQEVHAHLQTGFAAVVAAKFPVLSHQWQTVLKFRCVCCVWLVGGRGGGMVGQRQATVKWQLSPAHAADDGDSHHLVKQCELSITFQSHSCISCMAVLALVIVRFCAGSTS